MTRPHAGAAFHPASEPEWRQLAVKALKGADFEAKLVSRSADGLRIEPLYAKAAGGHPRPVRAGSGPWRVVQRIDLADPEAARRQALEDLENGASGLVLVFADAPTARGFGLADAGAAAIARALDGVMIDLVALRLEAGRAAPEAAQALVDLARSQNLPLDALDLDLGLDPHALLALDPAGGDATAALLDAAVELASAFGAEAKSRFLRVDGRVWHEAGASEAQELALALAAGVDHLRGLEARGIAPERGRRMIAFLLAADADEFLGIAKFRALRRLWACVEAACGLAPMPIRLDAETSFRMLTRRDPHVNLLRSTTAAFSAGLGGADSVTVLPFTQALGLPDASARRIARNTQIILIEESGLGHVADPAGGAGGFEALTDELCAAAWALFQRIEAAGGIAAALGSGLVAGEIAAVAEKRERDVRRRKLPITGTSAYPHLDEATVAVLAPLPAPAGAADVSPFAPHRTAEPFERLRDRAEAIAARRGRGPSVFLANLGTPAAFSARAGFARDLFEASGIAAPMNDGFSTVDALVAAAVASGADAVCLCSSDEVYERETGHATYEGETLVEEVARRLKAAGIAHVALAGRPGERETAYRHAGVEAFLFVGCDALDYPGLVLDRLDEALK
ncbi:methylmalonyl-CoA mutase subunit beta [Kaistia adipata]|uniref:methylmalonyl-CoA mutase subunit beta n=1 Tax=Kaistia adipata TaxID=166954 RepID=UPI000685F968|nr:methylmalonyl-CoA mutase subunit beta [Kaistia adipata]